MDRLHVATLNLRNLADRWDERLPLLLADMAALQPDLLGLQEVVYPLQQDRLLGAAGEAWQIFLGGSARASVLALGALIAWLVLPLEAARRVLARRDLHA